MTVAPQGPTPEPLWFRADQVEAARRRWWSGDVFVHGILRRAHAARERTDRDQIGALAVIALVESSVSAAQALVDLLAGTTLPAQDLGVAHLGLQVAVAQDCCRGLIDDSRSQTLRETADAVLARLRSAPSSHNPHAVQNNWWGVVHGGALLAALCADHHGDHDEQIRWALGRCRAFSQHFGPAGLYHEGLGYELYTLSHLLPALAAADQRGLIDLAGECPWVRSLAHSLYAATVPAPSPPESADDTSGAGLLLSWNDAGLSWWSGIVSPLALHYADPLRRPALRAWSRRLEGPDSPDPHAYGAWEGWPFAVVLDDERDDLAPMPDLPRRVSDSRQGLGIFRDRWRDGDDTVLGCYARATHIGGHSHDDGGSIRLSGLGRPWIIGGGQARASNQWQSVAAPEIRDQRAGHRSGNGAVIWDEVTAGGGVYGMDLRKVSGAYHERYVSLAGDGHLGIPAAVAMLDCIDDHLDRSWTWRLTFCAALDLTFDDDGLGFALAAHDGTMAQCRFLGTAPQFLRRETCPESERTFSNGQRVRYPCRPVVAVDFAPTEHLVIYAAIVLTRGQRIPISRAQGADLRIGAALWHRPFSHAVPVDYDCLSGGTLSRWPAGRPALVNTP